MSFIYLFTRIKTINTISTMKNYLLVIAAFAFLIPINAQQRVKTWDEGALNWFDFQLSNGTDAEASRLSYNIYCEPVKSRQNDTTIIRLKAIAYVDRDLSWVKADAKSNLLLKYNQVIFNIMELYRRQLQDELNSVNSLSQVSALVKNAVNACNQEVRTFQLESNKSNDSLSIVRWDDLIQLRLNDARSTADELPAYTKSHWGYGVHGGLGSSVFSGSLADYFDPTFNVNFGFDIAYKRLILTLDGALSTSHVRTAFEEGQTWAKGDRANYSIATAALGYTLLSTHCIKITPMAGCAFSEFALQSKKKGSETKKYRINSLNWMAGLSTDLIINHRVNMVPNIFMNVRENVETSICARVYVAQTDYTTDINGYTINFAVGLSGFGNMIKLHR